MTGGGRTAPASGPDDRSVVARQIGREPRGTWRVAGRCVHGYPQLIATSPVLEDGSPFPTLYWLTCPFLSEEVSGLESGGEVSRWAGVLAADQGCAAVMREADASYRSARESEAAPLSDPCAGVGIAGQADPLATKCLHAHVAAFLGGVCDPVGETIVSRTGRACADVRCASHAASAAEDTGTR